MPAGNIQKSIRGYCIKKPTPYEAGFLSASGLISRIFEVSGCNILHHSIKLVPGLLRHLEDLHGRHTGNVKQDFLIVDDIEENRHFLGSLLKGFGYEVVFAVNGKDALEKLCGDSFNMIISDILMPEMDGFQLLKNVKDQNNLRNIPFVFYTATYGSDEDKEFGLKLGANEYIRKPIDPEKFIKIIQDIIRDAESGKLKATKRTIEKAEEVLKLYNERIIRKLEEKILELEREIAERKKAEDAIRESKIKLQVLYDSSSDAIMLIDEKGFFDCNKAALRLFGCTTKEQFCGRHPANFSPPTQPDGTDSMTYARNNIALALKEGRARFEHLYRRLDGTDFPAQVLLDRIVLGGKEVLQARVIDITERKRAEEKIRRLVAISDQAAEGIAVADLEGNIQYVNHAWAAMHGYESGDELLGRHLSIFHTEEQMKTEVIQFNEEVMRLGHKVGEVGHKRRDGTTFQSMMNVAVLKDEQDRPYAIAGFAYDITERKKNEEEMRKLLFAIEQSANAVIITDTSGNIEYVNPRFTELTGYTADEAIGQNPKILKSGEMSNESYKELWETITSGKSWRGEFHNKKKSGELYWEKAMISPITDESGAITNYLAIKEDITKQKETEKERQILEQEMIQARKLEAVGSLAAGIAHEINTPIQFVGDNTNFIADSFKSLISLVESYDSLWQEANAGGDLASLDSQRVKARETADFEYLKKEIPSAIEQTLEGVQRVTKIVRAMKDFAHSDQGTKSMSKVNDMLESTLTVARNEWKYVADIKTNFCQELPDIECYRDDLNQVFLNLLINAAHTIADVVGDGSAGKGIITVSTLRDNGNIVIKISDTGKGIPESIQDRIFEPFFSTKDVGKGSGQGLAIARKIVVEKHQGSLNFETEEGKGTTFIIRLPMSINEMIVEVT